MSSSKKKKSNQYSRLSLKRFHKVEMLKNTGVDLREARARAANEYDQKISENSVYFKTVLLIYFYLL